MRDPVGIDKWTTLRLWACSLVGFWADLGWLVLVYCERKTLFAGWFGLAESNKRTGCINPTLYSTSTIQSIACCTTVYQFGKTGWEITSFSSLVLKLA